MTDTMTSKETVSKGPKKVDPTCLQVQHAILIPAGTILRQEAGKAGVFSCPVAYGIFKVTREAGEADPSTYKRVVT